MESKLNATDISITHQNRCNFLHSVSIISIIMAFFSLVLSMYIIYENHQMKQTINQQINQLMVNTKQNSLEILPSPPENTPIYNQLQNTSKPEKPIDSVNQTQLTNYEGLNAYLSLKGAGIKASKISINEASYDISTAIGPGICPWEPDESNCGYEDEHTPVWSILRIWHKNGKVFAINPQEGKVNGIRIEGFILLKETPNQYFTDAEINYWRQNVDSIVVK